MVGLRNELVVVVVVVGEVVVVMAGGSLRDDADVGVATGASIGVDVVAAGAEPRPSFSKVVAMAESYSRGAPSCRECLTSPSFLPAWKERNSSIVFTGMEDKP